MGSEMCIRDSPYTDYHTVNLTFQSFLRDEVDFDMLTFEELPEETRDRHISEMVVPYLDQALEGRFGINMEEDVNVMTSDGCPTEVKICKDLVQQKKAKAQRYLATLNCSSSFSSASHGPPPPLHRRALRVPRRPAHHRPTEFATTTRTTRAPSTARARRCTSRTRSPTPRRATCRAKSC